LFLLGIAVNGWELSGRVLANQHVDCPQAAQEAQRAHASHESCQIHLLQILMIHQVLAAAIDSDLH
jgi:hypothetical protein